MTPEIFHGFDELTRLQKFNDIIDLFNQEFADLKAKTAEALQDAKKNVRIIYIYIYINIYILLLLLLLLLLLQQKPLCMKYVAYVLI